MRIWIVTIGEPLPTDSESAHLLRHGMLAQILADAEHDVTWWTSSFDHQQKLQRTLRDTTLSVAANYRICLLRAPGYARNVSLARLYDHRVVGRKFAARATQAPRPDIILCSFPTIELSVECVRFGRKHGVPVVLDVRDMWPEIYYDILPRPVRRLGPILAAPLTAQARWAMRRADHLVAVSKTFLEWAQRLAGHGPRRAELVFPLAYRRLDVAEIQRKAAAQALRMKGVDPAKRICWFIGTLGSRYDVATIIEAARRLKPSLHKRVQFVLSGDGDCRRVLERQAEDLPCVVFTGWVETPEIAYLMSIADIGLVAIRAELPTLPNKMFEYFAAGLPVVSCVPGEAAGIIDRHCCGVNYEMKNADHLASVLTALLEDSEARRCMGTNALRLYETHFDHDVVYPRMAEALVRWAAAAAPVRKSRVAA